MSSREHRLDAAKNRAGDAALEFDTLARQAFRPEGVYLNAAAVHPMPQVAIEALREYAENRRTPVATGTRGKDGSWDVRELFARLINCSADDVVLTPSTTIGENLVALGLGLGQGR